jgi:uncharacterized protein YjbI with pentapeptide repeats
MQDTDLRRANLEHASLIGADLSRAYLQDADLRQPISVKRISAGPT